MSTNPPRIPPSSIRVVGTYGELIVSYPSGLVLSRKLIEAETPEERTGVAEYAGIVRFAVGEWWSWAEAWADDLPVGYGRDWAPVDIVDIGYVSADGKHIGPSKHHREWMVGQRDHPW